jgi:predicted secreted hydrolase
MILRLVIGVILALAACGAEFATARPGYRFEFPRDHYAHPQFKTEWWYWTGNLRDANNRRFGFELTFFRQAAGKEPVERRTAWDIADYYLAHLTLTDVAGGRFHHFERLNRAGPGLAGANPAAGRIWNGNWSAGLDHLSAVTESFRLNLKTAARKPPVIHGANGVSQKAQGEGRASHYVSITRLAVSGDLQLEGETFQVSGTAWMDHEFFTHQLEPEQSGWDWLSIQLEDGTELMLFRLRRRDGTIDPFSAGTYIDAGGAARHLALSDFSLEPERGSEWTSQRSGGKYPLRWHIRVPSLGLDLQASTPLQSQELVSANGNSPTYWEGAMDYSGTRAGKPVRGVGYLEMTGYAPSRTGPGIGSWLSQ